MRDAYRGDLIMLWLHVYVIIHLHYTGHFSKQVLLKVKYKYEMNKYINKRKKKHGNSTKTRFSNRCMKPRDHLYSAYTI